jgi:hypothetical protein
MVNDGKERTHMMIIKFGALRPILGKVEENSNLPWVKHKCTKHLHWKKNIMMESVNNLSKKFHAFFNHFS